MGIEIDCAYKTWIKEPQILYRPKIDDKIPFESDTDEYIYYNTLMNIGCLSYFEKFINPLFDKESLEIYKEPSIEFIDKIKDMPDSELKLWFLKHKNKMIFTDYKYFYVASDVESYILNRWIGKDYIPIQEDGKTLYMAIVNLNHLYGLNLYDSIISSEELFYYDENDEDSKRIDNKITKNIVYLLNDIDDYLSKVKNGIIKSSNNDRFFEDRNERLLIIRDIVKQGAKMVYSF